MNPLIIQLIPKQDTDNQTFYIGKLDCNITFDLNKGQQFYVYLEDGIQQLHIAPAQGRYYNDPSSYYSRCRKKGARNRHSNLPVELKKQSAEGKTYYSGELCVEGKLDGSRGLVFLVFTADPGDEELQISSGSRPNNSNRPRDLKKS